MTDKEKMILAEGLATYKSLRAKILMLSAIVIFELFVILTLAVVLFFHRQKST